ncbi:uncharacterized protein TNCV_3487171 [Trichonephila clavipes]|nr:uncharacterized protein TNCV_3487171 [Trichonephila clavipes]
MRYQNLGSWQPLRRLPLPPVHHQVQLQLDWTRSTWNSADWGRMVFSDVSRFELYPNDNCGRLWGHPGKRGKSVLTIARRADTQQKIMGNRQISILFVFPGLARGLNNPSNGYFSLDYELQLTLLRQSVDVPPNFKDQGAFIPPAVGQACNKRKVTPTKSREFFQFVLELEISFEPTRRIRRKHTFGNGSKDVQLLYGDDLRRRMVSSIDRITAEIRERFQQLQNVAQKVCFFRSEVILSMDELNLDQAPRDINK